MQHAAVLHVERSSSRGHRRGGKGLLLFTHRRPNAGVCRAPAEAALDHKAALSPPSIAFIALTPGNGAFNWNEDALSVALLRRYTAPFDP